MSAEPFCCAVAGCKTHGRPAPTLESDAPKLPSGARAWAAPVIYFLRDGERVRSWAAGPRTSLW